MCLDLNHLGLSDKEKKKKTQKIHLCILCLPCKTQDKFPTVNVRTLLVWKNRELET